MECNRNASHINLSYFRKYLGNNQQLLQEVITHFVNDAPFCMDEMVNSTCTQDWDNVRYLAHKLKSNIDTFGIASSQHIVRKIEDYTRFNVNLEVVPDLVETLNKNIQEAVEELETYL